MWTVYTNPLFLHMDWIRGLFRLQSYGSWAKNGTCVLQCIYVILLFKKYISSSECCSWCGVSGTFASLVLSCSPVSSCKSLSIPDIHPVKQIFFSFDVRHFARLCGVYCYPRCSSANIPPSAQLPWETTRFNYPRGIYLFMVIATLSKTQDPWSWEVIICSFRWVQG